MLAESEIINHVSTGVSIEDILHGIYDSLADRATLLMKRVEVRGRIAGQVQTDGDKSESQNSSGETMFIGGSDAARHGSSPGRALESESRSACRLPVRVRPGRRAVGTETAAVSNARSVRPK